MPLYRLAVQDVMENADYVRRESGDVRKPAPRKDAGAVGLPAFVDPGEILSRDMLDVRRARAVNLDEAVNARMDGVDPLPLIR